MKREQVERHQVWFYLGAVVLGLIAGTLAPQASSFADVFIWPVLALLLYATFTQVSLSSIPAAFKDRRFVSAALLGNFVVMPLFVWGFVQLAPADEAVRLGLLLVLLVPCTDWFITFSQIGGGDPARATAITPLNLVLQLLLLPVYLSFMADRDLTAVFAFAEVWPALLVVFVPAVTAAVTARWFRRGRRERVRKWLGWWPVPLLAVVILLVAAANVGAVQDAAQLFPVVLAVAVTFLIAALVLAKILARLVQLPAQQGRTLAFALGTRNSFIVLPFALALPAGWEAAAIVVVLQSLIELFGMIFYVWFVPNRLFAVGPSLRSR